MRFASRGNLEEMGRQIDRAWARKSSEVGQPYLAREGNHFWRYWRVPVFKMGMYRTRSNQIGHKSSLREPEHLLEDVVVEKSGLRPVGNAVTVWTWDGSLIST